MFAFRIEREEHRGDDDDENYLDQFVEEGNATSSSSTPVLEDLGSESDSDRMHGRTQDRSRLLRVAKRFRSSLKHKLLQAMKRKKAHRGDI